MYRPRYGTAALRSEPDDQLENYTILNNENVFPNNHAWLRDMSEATGLPISKFIEARPERIALQLTAALVPLKVKVADDQQYLDTVNSLYYSTILPSMEKLGQEIIQERESIRQNAANAVEEIFSEEPPSPPHNEVADAALRIRRLISLRANLGMIDSPHVDTKELTSLLTASHLYNKMAVNKLKPFVLQAIETCASSPDSPLELLAASDTTKRKHIAVIGGQGSGKTTLRADIVKDRITRCNDTPACLNIDVLRPLLLEHQAAARRDGASEKYLEDYGRFTEDEARVIKDMQWRFIGELSQKGQLPNLVIDSSVITPKQFELLSSRNARESIIFIHVPYEEAKSRVLKRAHDVEGIPGVNHGRLSLEEEVIEGHHKSSQYIISLLIHNVGTNTKIKVLDGTSPDKIKPVIAHADLKRGFLDIRDLPKFLDLAQKSSIDYYSNANVHADPVDIFNKLALTISDISFTDKKTGAEYLKYSADSGIRITNYDLYRANKSESLEQAILILDTFYHSNKGSLLRKIDKERGQKFETREPFVKGEESRVFSGHYETEVPVVNSADSTDQTLELRHIAKRGKFLDGQDFDPWRSKAPDDVRMLASRLVVDSWLNTESLDAIIDNVLSKTNGTFSSQLPAVVHIASPVKDTTRPGVNINYMALTYGIEITERLNQRLEERGLESQIVFRNDRPMISLVSDRVPRTTAGIVSRLTSHPVFDPSEFHPGDMVLLADEHIQAGGVAWALHNIGNSVPIDIIGYAALSSHNLCQDLRISPPILTALDAALEKCADHFNQDAGKYKNDLDRSLSLVGLSRQTITNMEALYIIAMLINGEDRDEVKWFNDLKKAIGDGNDVREGLDSFSTMLEKPPISPGTLGKFIKEGVEESRRTIYHRV
ncbi:MAG TPA: hypothetical protein VFT64_02300 [Rickettsiales bacterium]|nr:hypothetical protein [Rickettsiales bacterium]